MDMDMDISSDSNSQDEKLSDFSECSDSSHETGSSSDSYENEVSSSCDNESSSDDKESQSSRDDDRTNESSSGNDSSESLSDTDGYESSSDDGHKHTFEWNSQIPKKPLKLFNDTSNVSHQNYSNFRPIDFFKLLFTEQLLQLIWKQTNIYGGEYVSIDESMVKFKGRCSLKQYVPMKPIKRGFKIWVLADSANGYMYDFQIYKGKDTDRTTSLGEHVVKTMVKEIHFSYRKVFFDNYFTTPDLLRYLYKKGLYAAGTIRGNRKNLPADFCCSNQKLNYGEYEYITSDYLVLYKWQDKKPVFLLSNFHDPTSYGIIYRKKKDGGTTTVTCPTSIIDYNRFMGGVDRADQRKESYALDRKSRRWWLRIFFNFLNISLSNSFVIYESCTGRNLSYLEYLSSITRGLQGKTF
ncbi:unnamed protein product [Adineta steineri]|uniref:PiggyBac transposable element-derived protein domain-containing protein n=1 Tax=Adineta steineri TaxID=433720 RepID=A0A815HV34_9BILA|nr:unnamed protein product [Adineta steineri]CAF1340932.1 unnamed protein product [Adineta steineri]CAF1356661.1 unnamed protein product [Adineta steineri]